MNNNKNVTATFKDKYGEEKTIHYSKGRLMVKRNDNTLFLTINPVVCKIIGRRISEIRKKKHLSLEEFCIRSGIASSTPKSRMWEIENNVRQHGVKLGTLYCIASALEVELTDLLPSVSEIMEATEVQIRPVSILSKAS